MIAFSGVRSSWLILARNSDLARLAASARVFSAAYLSVEFEKLLLLLLELPAREPELRHARPELLLALGEALLASLQNRHVRADAHIAAVTGAALVDMQPAAILQLRFVGASVLVLAVRADPLAQDRVRGRADDVVISRPGADGAIGQPVELLVLAVAHDEAVLRVPEHESLGDRIDRVA